MIYYKLQLNDNETEVMLAAPKMFHNHPSLPPSVQINQVDISLSLSVCSLGVVLDQTSSFERHVLSISPRLGAADTEIKVPSGKNTELKRSPFQAWSRSVYIVTHATLTAREFFLAYFYPSSPFNCIFSKTSPNFFLCWLWLTPDPV